MSLFVTNNPCVAWYYPKYTCYSIFGALACVYTISAHVLFIFKLIKSPLIAQPVVVKRIDGSKRRLAIVTGSNTGVGYQTAKVLVVRYGIDEILACRSKEKALKSMQEINQLAEKHGKASRAIFLGECDLSSFASVRRFVKTVKEKYQTLDILVNNAGMNRTGRTEDGYDLLFQTCFLGHFLLTKLLFELFPNDGRGRVVNLSSVKHHFQSNWTGFVSLDETYWRNSARLHYQKNQSYPNAKLAAIFFTLELNRRFNHGPAKRVCAFVANPGAVNSDIWRHLAFQGMIRPILRLLFLNTEQRAATSVAAAIHDNFKGSDFYLEPYWMPSSARYSAPFPVLEMMGPFVGFRVTQPRLPGSESDVKATGEALCKASEALTDCRFAMKKASSTIARTIISNDNALARPQQRKSIDDESRNTTGPRPALGLVTNTAPRKDKVS